MDDFPDLACFCSWVMRNNRRDIVSWPDYSRVLGHGNSESCHFGGLDLDQKIIRTHAAGMTHRGTLELRRPAKISATPRVPTPIFRAE